MGRFALNGIPWGGNGIMNIGEGLELEGIIGYAEGQPVLTGLTHTTWLCGPMVFATCMFNVGPHGNVTGVEFVARRDDDTADDEAASHQCFC